MRINTPPQRRKVQQLQTHRHDQPRDNQPGARGPQGLLLAKVLYRKIRPEAILEDPDDHVGRHVVAIVPLDKGEVIDVRGVCGDTRARPDAQQPAVVRLIEAEDAHGGEIEAIEDASAGGEVVHALGEDEIAHVEDGAPEPGDDAKEAKEAVVGHERVVSGELAADDLLATVVGVAVENAEEHREGLLDAKEAHERPFAVELLDGLAGVVAGGRHGVLAGVVAFGGAGPEEEAEVEGDGRGRVGEAVRGVAFLFFFGGGG